MNETIDIKSIVLLLLRRIWILILAFLLCFIFTYCMFERPKVPVYSATAMMYVSNTSRENSSSPFSSSNQANALALINTCSVIVKSNSAMAKIMDELDTIDGTADGVYVSAASGTKYTAAAVAGMVSLSSVNNTEVMAVRVTCRSSADAVTIADAIVDVVPVGFEVRIRSGDAKKVDAASPSGMGNRPSFKKPMIYGLVAAAAAAAVIILINSLDTRIRSKEDIISVYNVPVIGEIPDFAGKNNERYYARYEYHKK